MEQLEKLRIASLNGQGLNEATSKRIVDIIAIRKTKVNANATWNGDTCKWFFSSKVTPEALQKKQGVIESGGKRDREIWDAAAGHLGIGFVISNKLLTVKILS